MTNLSEAVNGVADAVAESAPAPDPVSVSEQVYREKLAALKAELGALSAGTHGAYTSALAGLQRRLREDLETARLAEELERERIEADRVSESTRHAEELAERKAELVAALLGDLDEKRKAIEAEHAALDLAGDSLEAKALSTRKLRRRPNEPAPREERRSARRPPPHVALLLSEAEVGRDLAIVAGRTPPPPGEPMEEEEGGLKSSQDERRRLSLCPGDTGAILENGRLHYENKCYLRAQAVYVETTELGRVAAVIQCVGDFDISLKTTGEGKRISINLWELRDGRAILRKRTA